MACSTNFIELEGMTIGFWKVGRYLGHNKWECTCLGCNKQYKVIGSLLRNGGSTKCTECAKEAQKGPKNDMKGMIVGNVTVDEYLGGGLWGCTCSCGEKIKVKGFNLRAALTSGKTYRCAKCSNEAKRDKLEGTTIHNWDILRYVGNGMYECRCKCNKSGILTRSGKSIKTGVSKSCGCNTGKHLYESKLNKYGETCSNKINNPRNEVQIEAVSCPEALKEFIRLNFESIPNIRELSEKLAISECMTLRKIHKFNMEDYVIIRDYTSRQEAEILSMMKLKYTEEHIVGKDRKALKSGKEIDIYFPDKRVGLEFNGNYWHSSVNKNKDYHQEKSLEAIENNIRLIHIFEYEWNDIKTRDKIIDLIDFEINKADSRVVQGRTSIIKEIERDVANEFLENNHLQGSANASVNLGLFSNDELIGVMTFGKPRFNNDCEWELIRLCWKAGVRVIGGAPKLFKYFKEKYKPTSIISYCDISKFNGGVYKSLGFELDGITEPNYVWVDNYTGEILPRYKTMKHKLVARGLGTAEQTENEIMESLGYIKIYDCGNARYIWSNRSK